jgi:DNA-binding GntR family transcriptional regulator
MTRPALPVKRDQIVDELRRRILSGTLPRGARLPQDELARDFGASSTPVREALRLLEAEGLVVAEPHRGVRVAGVDLAQVTATYVVRRLVESYAMRRATLRLSRHDLARARALLDAGPAGGDPGPLDPGPLDPGPLDPGPVDLGSARDRNRAFHFLLYERCGMPELVARIAAMWQAFPWDLMLDSEARAAASHREHLDLLAALEAGDPDAVAAATERHLSNGFAAIRRQLTGGDGPDPFGLDVD